jgi:hypothetical protein
MSQARSKAALLPCVHKLQSGINRRNNISDESQSVIAVMPKSNMQK